MSFSDKFYFTAEGRRKLNDSFQKNKLINLTADIKENIDHIILSGSFIAGKQCTFQTWNQPVDKKAERSYGGLRYYFVMAGLDACGDMPNSCFRH